MKTYKCGRCGALFTPEKRFNKGKLRYGRDRMRLCADCDFSYMLWSVSAEVEKAESRKAEREFLISLVGEDNGDFNIPAEITDFRFGGLGVTK